MNKWDIRGGNLSVDVGILVSLIDGIDDRAFGGVTANIFRCRHRGKI